MSQDKKLRTFDDLLRVVRALAYEFKTDTVFIVGSQAAAPTIVRPLIVRPRLS